MKVFQNIDDRYFSLNGIRYPKIYQPLKQGQNDLSLCNIYDTGQKLFNSINYSEIEIDGTVQTNQATAIFNLLPVVYASTGGVVGGSGEWGGITGTIINQTDLMTLLNGKADVGLVVSWAQIESKPTTISGFGITDAFTQSIADGRYLPLTGKAADSNLLDGYNSSTTSISNTVAVRDSAGDISSRLFRSEYDTTNTNIGFIMTQVNTSTDNYIRPTTPAQFRAAVTNGFYLPIGGKAADANLLDGLNSTDFLRSNGKAVDSNLLDGLDSTAFLRSTGNINTAGSITAASFKTGLWTIDQSGTSLIFQYNGVTKFTLTSTGNLQTVGNVTAG